VPHSSSYCPPARNAMELPFPQPLERGARSVGLTGRAGDQYPTRLF